MSVHSIVVLVLCVASVCCGAKRVLDAEQEVAVKNVFQHMLKLEPPRDAGAAAGRIARPPKHMLELYKKYSSSGGGVGQTRGNTVRSILPARQGSSPAERMLVFNVTCVDQSEEVNLAQLHLHRRRLPRVAPPSNRRSRILALPYRVRIFQVLSHRGRVVPLASVPVAQHTRGGWHSLDITAVLRELLLSVGTPSLQLGVRFEAPRNRPVALDAFLKTTSTSDENYNDEETSAFLVVFSDDNSLLTDEHRALRHTHALATLLREGGHDSSGLFEDGAAKGAAKHHNNNNNNNNNNTRNDDDLYLETSGVIGNDEVSGEQQHSFEDFPQGSKKKASITAIDVEEEQYNSFDSFAKKNKKKDRVASTEMEDKQQNSFEDFATEKKKGMKKKKTLLDPSKRAEALDALLTEEGDNTVDEDKVDRWQSGEDRHDEEQAKKTVKKFAAPRYRRVHPKTRYRVRPRPDVATADENAIKKRTARATDDESSHRFRRSIVDNELPDSLPRGGLGGGEIPETSPQTLLKTREHSRKNSTASRRRASQEVPARSSKWQGGGGSNRKRGRGKKRDNRKKGRKGMDKWHHNMEKPTGGADDWHENSARLDRDGSSPCHKNKLVVQFADIGWNDFIISPPNFEAHYCVGQCVFPLSKATKPTNHATIQSLVHLIGPQTEVPNPCCVPDKLRAVSLLYVEDKYNVVLRNYHDMSVESCACR